jgi:hypothetical protein
MIDNRAYAVIKNKWCMLITNSSLINILFVFFFLFGIQAFCYGQEEPQYDEITVYLKVQGIGGADIPALVKDGVAYLSISDVFNIIKIKNTPSARFDSLSGFFINTQDEYLIDRVKKQIVFQGKKIELKPDDLIKTMTNLYMKANLFGDIFGLNCAFNMRDVSVLLTTKLELPLIREMKMEQMRNNLKRLKGDVKADTTIGRSYPLFKFGMADWAVTSSQQPGSAPNTQMSLTLGSVVAGGEMNMGLNYDPASRFDLNQQTYLWRYANNDLKLLRQFSIGKMYPQSISSVTGALIGIQVTNSPTIYRRSFGTYTLSNVTEPGWQVELYVNNVLVDYTKADASGFYKFEVPLVYGVSELMVKMYGPWGEVRTKIQTADVPFSFLPPGVLEYNVNAGTIENLPNTKFTRTNINYGVSRRMSIGGGYEYFSSPSLVNSLPFVGSSIMLLNGLMVAGEYTFGVRYKSSLSYRMPSDLQIDLNYTGYEKNQIAIPNSPFEDRSANISMPIVLSHFSSYYRLSLGQLIYSDYKATRAEFLFTGNFNGISSNFTTTATWSDPKHINAISNLSLSFRLPHQFNIMPSIQYDYNQKRLITSRLNIEKPLFGKGYLNISYEHDFIGKINSINVGLRYDFSFMQTELASHFSKYSKSFSQTARGSLLVDGRNRYIGGSMTSTVGKGAFTFLAYLDLNGNGKRDKNEPKVLGLNLRVNGGRVIKSKSDSTIRVIDLPPYTSYLVELDKNSFQSISWHINQRNLNVYADPNQFKTIEIPVDVMAEASGTVNIKSKAGIRGLGRVYVCFYRNNETFVAKTLTEGDGYYSYMGLSPGKYIARMDSSQMRKINMIATPEFKEFTVKESKDGDFVEGLDFTLLSTVKDTSESILPKVEPKAKIINYASLDSKQAVAVPATSEKVQRLENNIPGVRFSQVVAANDQLANKNITAIPGDRKAVPLISKPSASLIKPWEPASQITEVDGQQCSVQYGEYKSEGEAVADQRSITLNTGLPSIIVLEGDVYKLWIEGFNSRKEARAFLASLGKAEIEIIAVPDVIAQNNIQANVKNVIKDKPVPPPTIKPTAVNAPRPKDQMINYADSVAQIYKFEPEGSKTRGFPVKAKTTVLSGSYLSIRIDGFIFDKSAVAALHKISKATNLPIVMAMKNGFYSLLIEGFTGRKEAKVFQDQLAGMGYKGEIVRGNL